MELKRLQQEIDFLKRRIENLEDLIDLAQAIRRNDKKPLIPLNYLVTELDISIL